MPFTYPDPAARVNAVLAQNAPLDAIPALLAEYRDADLRHARTQSDADLAAVYSAQDKVLEIIGDAFGFNFDSDRAWLAQAMKVAA